jgi:hypothetical protein
MELSKIALDTNRALELQRQETQDNINPFYYDDKSNDNPLYEEDTVIAC